MRGSLSSGVLSDLILFQLLVWAMMGMTVSAEERYFRLRGDVDTTLMGLTQDGELSWTNTAENRINLVETTDRCDPTAWISYVRIPSTGFLHSARLMDFSSPEGMVFIPSGVFTMGNCMDKGEGETNELPLHDVYVSACYMGRFEVTKEEWDKVYQWAITNGYAFDNVGAGKAINHPVNSINWYDTVKWCNARSQKEGLMPCYTVDGSIYMAGLNEPECNWSNGYRLPTEAEWENAARGGVLGHRFPWSDTDEIQHSRANYDSRTGLVYDTSLTRGYHPAYTNGSKPYTSPVGSFMPNGYGLYDIAGNLWEWCWDWYDDLWYTNPGATVADTQGPPLGTNRILRGGSWYRRSVYARCASRLYSPPANSVNLIGFRVVRSAFP